MTHHPCEGLSPTHHEVFEACAIGLVAPCSTWSIYKTLAARDKYSRGDNSWTHALLRLANEKKLPRARLLDASLDALKLGFDS